MGNLAKIEEIAPPSTTGIVSRLEDIGLVERSADPTDGRSTIVDLTESAAAQLEQWRRDRTAYLTARIESLSMADQGLLLEAVGLLERLIDDQ